MMSMFVMQTSQPMALPAKVLGCEPSARLASMSARYVTPAMGMSPPMPLPQVSMSGTTLECSMAHILPVRPAPAWTSSAM